MALAKNNLAAFRLFALMFVCLLFFVNPASAQTWVLSSESSFQDDFCKGKPVAVGYQFTILDDNSSYLRYFQLAEDLLVASKVLVQTKVIAIDKADVGIALGNEDRGITFEANDEGYISICYCEWRESNSFRYWPIKTLSYSSPTVPFVMKMVYETIPAYIRCYIDDKEVLSMSLENFDVGSPPRRLTYCAIKTASPKGISKASATYNFLEAKVK